MDTTPDRPHGGCFTSAFPRSDWRLAVAGGPGFDSGPRPARNDVTAVDFPPTAAGRLLTYLVVGSDSRAGVSDLVGTLDGCPGNEPTPSCSFLSNLDACPRSSY